MSTKPAAGHEATWVFDVRTARDGKAQLDFREPSPGLAKVGLVGSHAAWSNDNDLIWTVGNNVYGWRPGSTDRAKLVQLRASIPEARATGRLALTNATILPLDSDQVIKNGTVLIEDARIVAVGPANLVSIPAESDVIDVAGGTIMPGFVDTHAHPHGSSCCKWEFPRSDYKPYRASLAFGVTTIFDPQASDQQTAVFTDAELIAAGAMVGPRVYSAGTAIFGKQSNSENGALMYEGLSAMCSIVRQRALSGAILVKSYLISERNWRRRLVECARAEGVGATTEGGGDPNLQLTHYLDGHSATEHNLLPPVLREDVVQLIARSGIFYTPVTTALLGGQEAVRYFGTRGAAQSDERIRSFVYDKFDTYAGYGSYVPDDMQVVYDVARSSQGIIAAGGKIALGSHGQFDGIGLHHDLWMLQLGGIAPYDLLRAGTIWGAEKLGLSGEIGTIEPGKLADLAVLNCNPLGNIRCSADTRFVIKSGFVYDASTLDQIYPRVTRDDAGAAKGP